MGGFGQSDHESVHEKFLQWTIEGLHAHFIDNSNIVIDFEASSSILKLIFILHQKLSMLSLGRHWESCWSALSRKMAKNHKDFLKCLNIPDPFELLNNSWVRYGCFMFKAFHSVGRDCQKCPACKQWLYSTIKDDYTGATSPHEANNVKNRNFEIFKIWNFIISLIYIPY